jgi:DNA transformation protein
MTRRSELLDYLIDQLTPLGEARGRAMFGGHGVYLDGAIVGIVADDTFYLKVDDGNRRDFEAAGSTPFTYDGKGKPIAMSYWECPADVLEDPEQLRAWTLKALAASRRSRAKPLRRKQQSNGRTSRRRSLA